MVRRVCWGLAAMLQASYTPSARLGEPEDETTFETRAKQFRVNREERTGTTNRATGSAAAGLSECADCADDIGYSGCAHYGDGV